jgi:hypothetical protein
LYENNSHLQINISDTIRTGTIMKNKLLVALSLSTIISVIICIVLGLRWNSTKLKLDLKQSELDITKNELTSTIGQLQEANSKIVIIEDQLQIEERKYDLLKANYESDKSTWEEQTRRNNDNYASLKSQVDARLGIGKEAQSYITPNDPLVAATVKDAAGSFKEDVNQRWDDFKRLYDWVVNNIEYSYDSGVPILPSRLDGDIKWSGEYWKKPSETIEDKAGDCEDMACLLASMIDNYWDRKYGIWAIELVSDEPNTAGHVALAFPVKGNQLTILDPAGNYYTGYNSWYGLTSEDTKIAINDWLSYWEQEIPDGHVTKIFSETDYREFNTNQEFIEWANR